MRRVTKNPSTTAPLVMATKKTPPITTSFALSLSHQALRRRSRNGSSIWLTPIVVPVLVSSLFVLLVIKPSLGFYSSSTSIQFSNSSFLSSRRINKHRLVAEKGRPTLFLFRAGETTRKRLSFQQNRYYNPLQMSTTTTPPRGGGDGPEKTVAVIGSTGKLGREVVKELLTKNYNVKCLIRQDAPPTYLMELKGNIEFVKGDVCDVESLRILLKDTTACLAVYGATRRSKLTDVFMNVQDTDKSHAKQVNYVGVQNILKAAPSEKYRVVRITGDGEHPYNIFSILINLLGSFAKAWNYEGEQILRNNSNVEYTIIRPGIMKQADKVGANDKKLTLKDNGESIKVAMIPYGNIAELCVDCLEYKNTARSTLTAMTCDEGEGAESWKSLLSNVQPDNRTFPTSLLKEHRQAVALGASVLAAFFAVTIKGVLSLGTFVLKKLPF